MLALFLVSSVLRLTIPRLTIPRLTIPRPTIPRLICPVSHLFHVSPILRLIFSISHIFRVSRFRPFLNAQIMSQLQATSRNQSCLKRAKM